MNSTCSPSKTNEPTRCDKPRPCYLSVSALPDLSRLDGGAVVRRWTALCLDRRTVLASGELTLDGLEPLAVVRDRATMAALAHGLNPQQFVLDATPPAARICGSAAGAQS